MGVPFDPLLILNTHLEPTVCCLSLSLISSHVPFFDVLQAPNVLPLPTLLYLVKGKLRTFKFATRDGHGGVPVVWLIAPRFVRLPATISLPNLLINKPLVVEKVYYQCLPDQFCVQTVWSFRTRLPEATSEH